MLSIYSDSKENLIDSLQFSFPKRSSGACPQILRDTLNLLGQSLIQNPLLYVLAISSLHNIMIISCKNISQQLTELCWRSELNRASHGVWAILKTGNVMQLAIKWKPAGKKGAFYWLESSELKLTVMPWCDQSQSPNLVTYCTKASKSCHWISDKNTRAFTYTLSCLQNKWLRRNTMSKISFMCEGRKEIQSVVLFKMALLLERTPCCISIFNTDTARL